MTQLLMYCHYPCTVCLCHCCLLYCCFTHKKFTALRCCKTTPSIVCNTATFAVTSMPLHRWLIVSFFNLLLPFILPHAFSASNSSPNFCATAAASLLFSIFCCSCYFHHFPCSNNCWPEMQCHYPCLGMGCCHCCWLIVFKMLSIFYGLSHHC